MQGYLHVFDRSEDELKDSLGILTPPYWRSDVVLWNGTRTGKEYTIHVSSTGQLVGDMFLLDMLSDSQYQELVDIAKKMYIKFLNG